MKSFCTTQTTELIKEIEEQRRRNLCRYFIHVSYNVV
jgi:hypothetical protein